METQFGKAQKVIITVTGANAASQPTSASSISSLSLAISDATLASQGDVVDNTIELVGIADGTFTVVVNAVNSAGSTISSETITVTISDEVAPPPPPPPFDDVAVSLSVTISAPIDQTPAA